MSKKTKTKFITHDILVTSIKGAFIKLNPKYMIKNPVMFVVEIGFVVCMILIFFPLYFRNFQVFLLFSHV